MNDALIFSAYALSLVANLADWYTTTVGLKNGLVESNPIARLFLTKNSSVNAIVKCGIVPIIGAIVDVKYSGGSFNGILGIGIAIVAIRNYYTLRKAKISLK